MKTYEDLEDHEKLILGVMIEEKMRLPDKEHL